MLCFRRSQAKGTWRHQAATEEDKAPLQFPSRKSPASSVPLTSVSRASWLQSRGSHGRFAASQTEPFARCCFQSCPPRSGESLDCSDEISHCDAFEDEPVFLWTCQ